jgi:hypothetical protein
MKPETYRKLIAEHPELKGLYIFVPKGKDGRHAHYRRRAVTYDDRRARSPGQLKVQIDFAEAAVKVRGKKGVSDEGLPLGAVAVRNGLTGKQVKEPEHVKELRKALKAIGTIAELAR